MSSPNPIRTIALNNAAVAQGFKPKYTLPYIRTRPISVVISCVDPRADPKDFWAIEPHGIPGVIRNAGGRAVDAIRTLEVLSALGTGLESVAVVHHTTCGVGEHGIDDEYVKEKIKERRKGGENGSGDLDGRRFETFKHQSVEESVKEDMRLLLAYPLFPDGLVVLGYVLDDETGVTTEVFLE